MNTKILASSRFSSRLIAVLVIVLIQLPAITPAFDTGRLNQSDFFPIIYQSSSPRAAGPLTVFSNTTSFTVADRAGAFPTPPGVASLYPSAIAVSGLAGTVSDVNVTISNLTVGRPRDLEFLLVGPGGQTLVFISDMGGTAGCGVSGINLTIDDGAASQLPNYDATGCPPSVPVTSGSYRPTNYASGSANDTDDFPSPAPAGPHNDAAPEGASTLASVYNGINPNGTWNLYVVDDALGNTGTTTIAGGWSLDITTVGGIDPTTTNVISNLNPSQTGQSVSFTSTTINATTSTAVSTGTVTFTNNGVNIAGCVAIAVNGSGQAVCTTSALLEGTRIIAANYSGTATLGTSSGSVTQVVNSPTVVAGALFCNNGGLTIADAGTAAPVYPSNITVSGLFGTISTVKTRVNGFTAPRPAHMDFLLMGPTGSAFEFMSDIGDSVNAATNLNFIFDDAAATQPPQAALAGGTFRPTDYAPAADPDSFPAPAPAAGSILHAAPAGAATFTTAYGTTAPNGTWKLFAVDDSVGGGTSSITGWCVDFTLTPFATTTGITSSANPSVFGQPVTFTATVSSGAGTPTGNVQFFDNAVAIGGAVALNGSGQAQLTTSTLSVGNHTITANYAGATVGSGGGGFAASSGSLTGNPQVVNKANTNIGVGASVNPSATSQQVTFTATVSAQAPSVATVGANGSVTFFRNGQAFCSNTALNASSQATCQLTFTVAGNYNITAQYNGTTNFNTSNNTGSPFVQQVLGPTAANVNVSGRVVDTSGVGVYGAHVVMQDQQGNLYQSLSNPFGYFRFSDIPVGTYIVSAVSKRFQFEPRTINLSDDFTGLDFVALPEAARATDPPAKKSP